MAIALFVATPGQTMPPIQTMGITTKVRLGQRMAKIAFKRSKHPKPVGASLICSSQIVSASNVPKTSPVTTSWGYQWFQRGIHAEANLFSRSIPGLYRGAKVFVYRERKDGSLADSKPCLGCRTILIEHQVKSVTYFFEGQWVTERLDG